MLGCGHSPGGGDSADSMDCVGPYRVPHLRLPLVESNDGVSNEEVAVSRVLCIAVRKMKIGVGLGA